MKDFQILKPLRISIQIIIIIEFDWNIESFSDIELLLKIQNLLLIDCSPDYWILCCIQPFHSRVNVFKSQNSGNKALDALSKGTIGR